MKLRATCDGILIRLAISTALVPSSKQTEKLWKAFEVTPLWSQTKQCINNWNYRYIWRRMTVNPPLKKKKNQKWMQVNALGKLASFLLSIKLWGPLLKVNMWCILLEHYLSWHPWWRWQHAGQVRWSINHQQHCSEYLYQRAVKKRVSSTNCWHSC